MRHESGRTLVEMLGALAIMGILSVVGLAGYHYALKTTKANNVLYDARTIYALMLGHQNPVSDTWVENTNTKPITSYTFYQMYDKALKPFIKVSGIEKGICQRMLQMSSDAVSFLTSNNEPLTMCVDENDIVVNFNTEGKMATCTTQSDCLEEGSVCLSGQCTNCIAPKIPHENGTECVCVEGYRGDLCDTCADNYIMKEDECIRCPNGTGTNTEEYLGNALMDDYVGCYCKNANEWWNSSEQKCDVSQYQEVEYLESTGTQYIDTGLVANSSNKHNWKLELKRTTFAGGNWDLDGSASGGFNAIYVGIDNGTGFVYGIGNDTHMRIPCTLGEPYVYDLDIPNDYFKVKDKDGNYTVNVTPITKGTGFDAQGLPLWLFGYSGEQRLYRGCLYYAKFYDNTTLVRDFIPVKRKSDNVAGMWDNVSKTFFENKGSGTFITGPEVPNAHIQE